MSNGTENSPGCLKYFFEEIKNCEMCGKESHGNIILGQRLNQTQGRSPKRKTGISVSVMKCRNCQLVYPQPLPIPFDMQQHYGLPPEEYWHAGHFQWDTGYFSEEIKAAKQLLPFKEGMKALDVGAGLGKGMISLSKNGFDTYGFEPSASFYEKAISAMGISRERLKLDRIENVNYPGNQFDFITFGAVFEHLYHPAACLEKAMGWLKPGGIIHVEVPSSSYLIARLFNGYYRLRGTNYVTNISPMHVPFHLYEFGLKSFEALGKRLGYKIEKQRYEVCEIMHIPKLFHPFLKKYMQWTKTGMQMTVYLRK